jgi:signal transduction histidine kinase/streptogramin lyase
MRWLAALLLAAACHGAAAEALLERFSHTAWSVNEGAPADVWTLSRSQRGYLWLGTGLGLYRFDGVRFDRYPLREGQRLRSTNINALIELPNGDVWIGLYAGGTVLLRDGIATAYGEPQGMPAGRVLRFALAPDGSLWAASTGGLARFAGGRWQAVGADWSYPTATAHYVFVDRRGTLWVAARDSLMFLPAGERQFRRSGALISRHAVLAEDLQGRIWVSDALLGTRPLGPTPERPLATPGAEPGVQAKQMLFASDGSLWLTDVRGGVLRLPTPERVKSGQPLATADLPARFTRQQGLPADVAVPLVEDAEGQVWVGTNYGISSFRLRRLREVPALALKPHHGFTIMVHGDGVLATNWDQPLYLAPPAPPQPRPRRAPVRAGTTAPDGALWEIDSEGIWRTSAGGRCRIELGTDTAVPRVLALAPDASGGAWLAVDEAGIFHADCAGARRERAVERGGALPTAIASGDDGTVWFGYDDELLRLAEGRVTRYTAADGLLVGRAATIAPARKGGVYVAGEAGFARFDGQRFSVISAAQDEAFAHVTGIVEMPDGELWLNGGRGLLRVAAADVDSMFDRTQAARNYRLLDWRDGLPGVAQQAQLTPTAVRDRGGRIWVATNRGVAWIDPGHVPRNERPPPVEIQSLRAGDRVLTPAAGMGLPEGTRTLAIRFTALTLAVSDRARFRYRLDGIDADWQEAGHRREAVYANLGPGRYRFHVIAANADGVWNAEGATLAFEIAPRFWQSPEFQIAAVLAALALAWGLYLLRARAIATQVRLRLDERHRERERISRELHDTLLQGFQGLILSFHAATQRVQDLELRQWIERAIDRAEAAMIEGRERMRELRELPEVGSSLESALAQLGGAMVAAGCTFRVSVVGTRRRLSPLLCDELLLIAREALSNAARHAQAGAIEVTLVFADEGLRLRIEDDGIGIAAPILERGDREGHYGLRTMRERARRLGGTLAITSAPAGGTRVGISLPAALVYADAARRGAWLNRWRRLRTGSRR